MLRILFVITGLLSFSIEAKPIPLNLLCEGTLSYGNKTEEDALVEFYFEDIRPTIRCKTAKCVLEEESRSFETSYVIFPFYIDFYGGKENFSEFFSNKDKFEMNINYALARTNIQIQRKTGKISIFGKIDGFSGVSEWLYNGVCEKVEEKNKF